MKSPISEIREQLGLTQVELCIAVGCSQALISNIEAGLVDHLPQKMRRSLRRLHMNVRELEKLQRDFAASKRQEVEQRITAKLTEK